jgi:hypothetical protein
MRPTPVVAEPPPVETPGAGNNVTPPAVFQPKPATTPANTPPRSVTVAEPPVTAAPPVTKPAAPSPKVQAAAETISEWTKAEYDAVKDLPVKQRVAYLRMRQGGYAADEAMKTVEQMQKATTAGELRRMSGSQAAGDELFPNIKDKDLRAARVKDLAPGPSRSPLQGTINAMSQRYQEILADPKYSWLLPLLGAGTLGTLATRKDAQ